MAILRTRLTFERNFVTLPNHWARDGQISLRARGLLTLLLSHEPGWRITVESLVRDNPEGREAIRGAMSELRQAGYLSDAQLNDPETGKFAGRDYALSEPIPPENRRTGLPPSVNPSTKNPIEIEDSSSGSELGTDRAHVELETPPQPGVDTAAVAVCLRNEGLNPDLYDIARAIPAILGRTSVAVARPAAYVAKGIRAAPDEWLVRQRPRPVSCAASGHKWSGQWDEICLRCGEMNPGWQDRRDAAQAA